MVYYDGEAELRGRIAFLEHIVEDLGQKLMDVQPPPPIILQVTQEQADNIKKVIEDAKNRNDDESAAII